MFFIILADKATNQMVNQEEKQQISHKEIMKDLQQIREKAQNVLGKIGNKLVKLWIFLSHAIAAG